MAGFRGFQGAEAVARTVRKSLAWGHEHEPWLDAGNQIKVPITMQKRHAADNGVDRN